MFLLSEIGTAAAMGHPVDIPVIIRAFAADYFENGPDRCGLIYDADFLFALDAGTGEEDATAVAPSYFIPYWESLEAAKEANIYNPYTREQCLVYHRHVTDRNVVLPQLPPKPCYTWGRGLRDAASGVIIECRQCRLYRGVSIGVLDDLQDLRHQVNGLTVAVQDRGYHTERRAAGFHQLFEAAAMKETRTQGSPLHKKGKANARKQSKIIRGDAANELHRLEQLPAIKWTWGPDLNMEEAVKALQCDAPDPRGHSGYQVSLPDDSCGTASVPSSPGSDGVYSDIAGDIMVIPKLALNQIPVHFRYPPLCNYRVDPGVRNTTDYSVVIPPLSRNSMVIPPPENFGLDADGAYSSDAVLPVSCADADDAFSSTDAVSPDAAKLPPASSANAADDAYSSSSDSDGVGPVGGAFMGYSAAPASSANAADVAYSFSGASNVAVSVADAADFPNSVSPNAAMAAPASSTNAADDAYSDVDDVHPVGGIINPLASVTYSDGDSDTSDRFQAGADEAYSSLDDQDQAGADNAYSSLDDQNHADADKAYSSLDNQGRADDAYSSDDGASDDEGDDPLTETRRELPNYRYPGDDDEHLIAVRLKLLKIPNVPVHLHRQSAYQRSAQGTPGGVPVPAYREHAYQEHAPPGRVVLPPSV